MLTNLLKFSDFEEMNRKMVKNLESLEERETQILSFSEFLAEKKILKRGNNPCWPGYRQVGIKTKNGRSVPNCVPVKN